MPERNKAPPEFWQGFGFMVPEERIELSWGRPRGILRPIRQNFESSVILSTYNNSKFSKRFWFCLEIFVKI